MAAERLAPAFPAVASQTAVVGQLAVEQSVAEPAGLVPAFALAEAEPSRAVVPVAAAGPARVPPSLRRDLPVPPTSSARQAVRR